MIENKEWDQYEEFPEYQGSGRMARLARENSEYDDRGLSENQDEKSSQKQSKKQSKKTSDEESGGFFKSLIIDLLVAVLIAEAVLFFVRPTIVQQESMLYTLESNDYILLLRRAYSGDNTPERGDIIVFQSNLTDDEGNSKLLIKRVIGLPGDVITITGGYVYINGELYEEDYLKDGMGSTTGEIYGYVVPEGYYFVMGDNRLVSVDSRSDEVGCVSEDDIYGKAWLRLYPFDSIGFVN